MPHFNPMHRVKTMQAVIALKGYAEYFSFNTLFFNVLHIMYTTVAAIVSNGGMHHIHPTSYRQSYTWSSKQLSLNMPNTQNCY